MIAETSTAVSSISGSNINTISGATSRPQHVQKRTVHQFETDKIEVQLSEQTQAPPSGISKVSRKLSECPRLHGTGNFPIRESNPIMNFFCPRRIENSRAHQRAQKESYANDVAKAKWENYGFFSALYISLKMIFPILMTHFPTLHSS